MTDVAAKAPSSVRTAPDPRRRIALIVGIAAAVVFVVIVIAGELTHESPYAIDVWWHGLMVATLTPVGVVVAWIPSIVGGIIGMIVTGILLVVIFLAIKRPWDAVNIAAAIVIVVAIGAPMSYIIARVRPSDSLAETINTSFPSGHTAVATTVAITLGLILRRWYVWVIGVLWVMWMFWARTYLHAHWLSDVIAGLVEGIAVATLVWCAMEAIRDRRETRRRELA